MGVSASRLQAFEFQEAPGLVLEEIASHCDTTTLVRLGRTCRRLHEISALELARRPPPIDEPLRAWIVDQRRRSRAFEMAFKVPFLGDNAVGKTALIIRYVTGEYPGSTYPTIGAAFLSKQQSFLGDPSIVAKLNIWDTAGQERFNSLAPMYYRRADAVVVLIDPTTDYSIHNARMWLERLAVDEPTVPVVLAATKCDAPPERRSVSDATCIALAAEFNVPFRETSAKDGTGVDELFEFVALLAARRLKAYSPPVNT